MKVFQTLAISSFLLCGTAFASGVDMSGMVSSLGGVANTMMQGQQQQQQAEEQFEEREAEILQMQREAQTTEDNGAMNQMLGRMGPGQQGYPVIDPFASQGYWQNRGMQYEQSMSMAAMRSQLGNEQTKTMIDQEFQQTQAMMSAVGGAMQQAGDQLIQMGEASAEAEASEEAEAAARDENTYCPPGGGNCVQLGESSDTISEGDLYRNEENLIVPCESESCSGLPVEQEYSERQSEEILELQHSPAPPSENGVQTLPDGYEIRVGPGNTSDSSPEIGRVCAQGVPNIHHCGGTVAEAEAAETRYTEIHDLITRYEAEADRRGGSLAGNQREALREQVAAAYGESDRWPPDIASDVNGLAPARAVVPATQPSDDDHERDDDAASEVAGE